MYSDHMLLLKNYINILDSNRKQSMDRDPSEMQNIQQQSPLRMNIDNHSVLDFDVLMESRIKKAKPRRTEIRCNFGRITLKYET